MEYLVYIAHSPFHDPSYIHSAFYFPFSFPRLGTLDMHGLVLYVYTFNPDTYTCCLFIFICSSIYRRTLDNDRTIQRYQRNKIVLSNTLTIRLQYGFLYVENTLDLM